ncbi:hypothetical protein K2X33_06905 [bacterium]|nr:hypothetical protein [bacterium]
MSRLKQLSTAFFAVGFMLTLAACSVRRVYNGDGNSNYSLTACTSDMSGTLVPINKAITDIKMNDSIFWMATVQGCTGRYSLTYAGGTLNFTSGGPSVFTKTYTTSGSQMESVLVSSLDANNNVIKTYTLQSANFTVAQPAACTVTASATNISGTVDSLGQMPQPVSFGFTVASTSSVSLNRVLKSNVALASSALNVSLPDAAALSHSLQVSLQTPGSNTLTFEVKDSAGNLGTCSSTVTITPVAMSAPSILSFSANPTALSVGNSVELTALVNGNVTSVEIDGVAATLTGSTAKRTVSPSNSGTITSTAKATGPGGSTTSTVTYKVAPGCALRLPATTPTTLPGTFNASVDIVGTFSGAYIVGYGIESVVIFGGAGFTNKSVPIKLFSAPTTLSLYVYGSNNVGSRCDAQIANGPLPTIILQGAGTDSTIQVTAGSGYTVGWNASGATACALTRNGTNVANGTVTTYTVLNATADTTYVVSCTNAYGTSQRTLNVDVVGGWFQANKQNCPTFCQSKSLNNILSPDSARCASGEVRPNSARGILTFPYGTWGEDGYTASSSSSGNYCYGVGQNPDHDDSDYTVGCFCGP